MKTGIVITIIVLVALVLGGIVIYTMQSPAIPGSPAGSSGGTTDTPTPSTPGNNPGTVVKPQTYNAVIKNFAFSPPSLEIKAGDSVVWQNQDSMTHTVTSDSGSELNSPNLAQNQMYTHQFTTPGTYTYHCSIHPSMKGTIIVDPNPDFFPPN